MRARNLRGPGEGVRKPLGGPVSPMATAASAGSVVYNCRVHVRAPAPGCPRNIHGNGPLSPPLAWSKKKLPKFAMQTSLRITTQTECARA